MGIPHSRGLKTKPLNMQLIIQLFFIVSILVIGIVSVLFFGNKFKQLED